MFCHPDFSFTHTCTVTSKCENPIENPCVCENFISNESRGMLLLTISNVPPVICVLLGMSVMYVWYYHVWTSVILA